MKKPAFLTLVFTLSTLFTYAQKIQGRVTQPDGKGMEYVTLALYKTTDSSLVTGVLSNAEGNFEFIRPKPDQYYVKASMVGMASSKGNNFEYQGGEKILEPITLKESSTQLSQVTITAKRPPVEVQAEKTILNVEGTITSTGLNALELLRKAPGVTIDNNDNINIKGKNAVKILIDNREIPLNSKSLALQLKGMQASEIDRIEVINNPSARYDASGNAGIINIRLKKNRALGTNGSAGFEGFQGITPKVGLNGNINHRESKYNVFGSYNNHYGRWHNEQNFDREQNGLRFIQETNSYYMSRWNSAKAGVDYNLNRKSVIGLLVDGDANPSEWVSSGNTVISNAGQLQADSILVAGNHIDNDRISLSTNINYNYNDTSGSNLNIDFNHGLYRMNSHSLQPNYYYTISGMNLLNTYTYYSETPTNIDINTLKSDWEQKLWNGQFSTGIKISQVVTDNTYDYFRVIDGANIQDYTVSNSFKYNERTSAAYINYNHQYGKLNIQAGLRVENTNYTGSLSSLNDQDGQRISDDYTDLFPSAAITFNITKKFGLNTTYSRRIDRPNYQDLNPFEYKLDELTYEKGNPLLRPQFTNSFEIMPLYNGRPVITFGYSQTTDLFTKIADTSGNNSAFVTMKNTADMVNYNVSLNLPTPFFKWWDGMLSVTAFHSDYSAVFREGFKMNKSVEAINLYAEQNFKLPKGFSLQFSGYYNSKIVMGTIEMDPFGSIDMGIRKKVLADKGEFKVRLGDIFNTAHWTATNLFTPGLKMTADGHQESRTITISFNYRFGSNEVKSSRQRRTGLEDESQRIKSGRG